MGDGNAHSANLDQTGKIIELADEGDDFSNLNSTGPLFDQLQRTVYIHSFSHVYVLHTYSTYIHTYYIHILHKS